MNTENIELCQLALIILVLPLIGFILQVFFGTRVPPKSRQGDWIPTLFIFAALCIACYMVLQFFAAPNGIEAQRWYPEIGTNWLMSGPDAESGFQLHFSILVDNLTIVMLFVVTLVSFLVHLYSMGYMHGEERYNRFFAFLGLFTFSMLGLCITNNLLFLFIFWELVGLCSYFLIGFYYEKKSAQRASIKAFMTTRLGDLGFFLAILIIAAQVRSLDFQAIFDSIRLGDAGPWAAAGGLLTFAGIALFFGPIGKSAQFPLHVWLPDAMEGPTPVSALIHAATMVAAGVYLVGRMFPFLAGAAYYQGGNFFESDALFFVALIGGITAFFAATIAFSQTDIKKVLAYSTISQLGYMMLGLGVGSLHAGLFHLTTHAFFKALLFLGSGSVIHAVHSNEMADMGGLRKKMFVTWMTFLIGTLAIAGLPFLSGFHSKEAILGQAYAYASHHGGVVAWLPFLFGIVTAGMTACYMFRLYFKVFHGEPKNEKAYSHAHESPWTMALPLVVLAVLAVVAGGVTFGGAAYFGDRVSSAVLAPFGEAGAVNTAMGTLFDDGHYTVMGLSIGMFVVGVGIAALFFTRMGPLHGSTLFAAGKPLGALNSFLYNLWYIDRIFTWLALHVVHVFQVVAGAFDKYVIDGFVNFWGWLCQYATAVTGGVDYDGVDGSVRGIGELTMRAGRRIRKMQTGFLQEYLYASIFLFAGVLLISVLIIVLGPNAP